MRLNDKLRFRRAEGDWIAERANAEHTGHYRRLAGLWPPKPQPNAAHATGPIDDHSPWGSFRGMESVTQALMEASLKDALAKHQVLSPEEEIVLNAAEKTCGIEPGTWLQEIQNGKPATLNWQTLLQRNGERSPA